jgi:hypothetical protein
MDSAKAAETLRFTVALNPDLAGSLQAGAQALEAWAWVAECDDPVLDHLWIHGQGRNWQFHPEREIIKRRKVGTGPTPLAAVLDPMEKEGKG